MLWIDGNFKKIEYNEQTKNLIDNFKYQADRYADAKGSAQAAGVGFGGSVILLFSSFGVFVTTLPAAPITLGIPQYLSLGGIFGGFIAAVGSELAWISAYNTASAAFQNGREYFNEIPGAYYEGEK